MLPQGLIIYQGPSELDGEPIVVIATFDSANAKTGPMIQVWIIRADLAPAEARELGEDESICGDCPLRDGRCYVNIHWAPAAIYRAFMAGRYRQARPDDLALFRGRMLRLGAYGDPAACPVSILQALTSVSAGWTGYTHQWRRFPELAPYCMASVDSAEEHAEAAAAGWRTFRALMPWESPAPETIQCLAAAKGIQCADCRLCSGRGGRAAGARSVWIGVHGGVFTMNRVRKLAREHAAAAAAR